jgi:hypothetical protein
MTFWLDFFQFYYIGYSRRVREVAGLTGRYNSLRCELVDFWIRATPLFTILYKSNSKNRYAFRFTVRFTVSFVSNHHYVNSNVTRNLTSRVLFVALQA